MFLFGGGTSTQGLLHARLTLYPLNYIPSTLQVNITGYKISTMGGTALSHTSLNPRSDFPVT